jgi:hypothetical protein
LNVIELVAHLRSLPPESEILTVLLDPEMENPPEVVLADLYTIEPAQGLFQTRPKDPYVFIGSGPEYELMIHLMNEH